MMANKAILWFLRLFPEFRGLESQIKEILAQLYQSDTRAEQWQKEAESTANLNATLRDEIAELKTDKIMLQDRLESALADKSHLWTLVMQSLDSERQSLRQQVNELAKGKWGTSPYPENWSPPDKLTRDPNASKEAMGRPISITSDVVRRQAMQTLEDAIERQRQGT